MHFLVCIVRPPTPTTTSTAKTTTTTKQAVRTSTTTTKRDVSEGERQWKVEDELHSPIYRFILLVGDGGGYCNGTKTKLREHQHGSFSLFR